MTKRTQAVVIVAVVGTGLGLLWMTHSTVRQTLQPPHVGPRPSADQKERPMSVVAKPEPIRESGRPNRLVHEKSPYLLQHAYNPVDWYPWGEEAFAKARETDRPIFLSIGYSTCHWCHVMERESFEDPKIAAMMNRWFVNIKVDREEYPDVDHVYMTAVTSMTGRGGWPLTVLLTPDLKPFFGGTYFPPEPRHNMPGMSTLLPSLAEAWKTKREEVVQSAQELTQQLSQHLAQTQPGEVTLEALHDAFNQAAESFDPVFGGFGGAPKFPRSHQLSFLLRYWVRTGKAQAREMVMVTLDRLARGGIYDHLGGGFHRYSTDRQWLTPHFEKMLYDQALLARTYLEAYQISEEPWLAETARGIFTYVLRDLADSRGGLYSAEDADSEGEEGKFYVWQPAEVLELLGEEDGALINQFYGVTRAGNFEGETTILQVEEALKEFATRHEHDPGELATRIARARGTLLAARSTRIRPHRDDKILTSWNGLMIASLAYGGRVLQEPQYLEAARRAASFVLDQLRWLEPTKRGVQLAPDDVRRNAILLRRFRDGEAKYPGTLEDYAFFSYGLLELYEASFEPRWLEEARGIVEKMVEGFWDPEAGGFFFRSHDDTPLIARSKEIYDGALPSGNSIAALVLLRLGRLTAETRFEEMGRRVLEVFAQTVHRTPYSYPQLLIAWDLALGPTKEIVVAGDLTRPDTQRMVQMLHRRFLPRAVLAFHGPGQDGTAIEALIPYLKSQQPRQGKATAYVCENYICQLPTTSLERLEGLLGPVAPHAGASSTGVTP